VDSDAVARGDHSVIDSGHHVPVTDSDEVTTGNLIPSSMLVSESGSNVPMDSGDGGAVPVNDPLVNTEGNMPVQQSDSVEAVAGCSSTEVTFSPLVSLPHRHRPQRRSVRKRPPSYQ
jgi:hypothetical protein